MGKVITFGNFKGGTGKTTNCVMTAYALAQLGYKVLVIDKDPQANGTTFLYRTYESIHEVEEVQHQHYLLDGIKQGNLSNCILSITDNLDLIPTTPAFAFYPRELQKLFKGDSKENERIAYFKKLLEQVKGNYDFVFVDVPPTISLFTDAALFASDYVMIVMQTQEPSLQGAEVFVEYMQQMVDTHDLDLDVVGILPVILKQDSKIDEATLINAATVFGDENIFDVRIKMMERLKRYFITGITEVDHHDKNVLKVYTSVAKELLERIEMEVKVV